MMFHALQENVGDLMNRDAHLIVLIQENLTVVPMELITVSTHATTHNTSGDLIANNAALSAAIQERLVSFKMESVTVKFHAKMENGGEMMIKNVVPALVQEETEA